MMNLKELRELHKCANALLQQYSDPMIHHEPMVVHHVSDSILHLLDLCGSTMDVTLLAKDHLQGLHSAARRTLVDHHFDGGQHLEALVSSHNANRLRLKKEVVKSLRSLKDMIKHNKYVFSSDLSLIDSNLIVVVHVLREVRVIAMSIAESLLGLVSVPATCSIGSSYSSRVTKIMFEQSESSTELGEGAVLLDAGQEEPLQELEGELVCIMRGLIHTRVLLLNLLNNSSA